MTLVYIVLSFLILFLVFELIKRKTRLSGEITRKGVHLLGGVLVLYWSRILTQTNFIVLAWTFVLFFLVTHKWNILLSLHIPTRRTYGEITYVLGLLCLGYIVYPMRIYFQVGVMLLMLPDAISGFISYIKRKKRKTSLHLIIYILVSIGVLSFFIPLGKACLFAAILGGIEFFSPYGFDNITVPLAYAFLVQLFF